MKKKKIAFTLIELLISISIITLVSFSSISGFFNFLQEKEANMKIMEFSYYIEYLDKEVKNHEIFDYQVELKTNMNDSYIVYSDYFDTDYYQNINYLSNTIDINNSSYSWFLKIYKDGKLNYNSLVGNDSYTVDFDTDYDYKFISSLSGTTDITNLNNIELNRFDKSEKEMILSKIVDSEGSTSDIGNLTIRNIGGKKEFYDSIGIYYDEIYLYFENKGSESFLKLTN